MSEIRITGVYVQYYFICKRKLWLFSKNIKMEEKSELVAIGNLIDQHSYKRENKQICIDDTINIDFIDSKGIVNEIKKSRSIEKADAYQVKYYLYFLKQRGVENISGVIDYPKLKEKVNVSLSEKDEKEMTDIIIDIKRILGKPSPPPVLKTRICKKCAYFELCFI